MTAINKKVLSEIIAEEHQITKKKAAEIIDLLFDTISDTLRDGNSVEITGLKDSDAHRIRLLFLEGPRLCDAKPRSRHDYILVIPFRNTDR